MMNRNTAKPGISAMRKDALAIIDAGIAATSPDALIRDSVSYSPSAILTIDGESHDINGRIFVVGAGKASGRMAKAIEDLIGPDSIEAGIVNCNAAAKTEKIAVVKASHPIPDKRGVQGVERMLRLKEEYSIGPDDTVICLISGGGSALLPCPADGLSLDDIRSVNEQLIRCGADIYEINVVRKHLSKVKGGKLAAHFAPARVIGLIISDVSGNDINVIASGPTVPDRTTIKDAKYVLEKYKITSPKALVAHLSSGSAASDGRPAVQPDPCNWHNYVIGDNSVALQAMANKARELGYRPNIMTSGLGGETTAAAKLYAHLVLDKKNKDDDVFILGGETVPKLPRWYGKGGRNMHYVLESIPAFERFKGDWVVASVASDGSDFVSDAAGAIADNDTVIAADDKNMDIRKYIKHHDSYPFFDSLGSLVRIGHTGTNVADLVVYMLKRK